MIEKPRVFKALGMWTVVLKTFGRWLPNYVDKWGQGVFYFATWDNAIHFALRDKERMP